ncbi:MAG: AraC family transcriptional regulator [Clostridia bacterium]|nr:AraC family transcriptional regulator [Clostridia bacterium]
MDQLYKIQKTIEYIEAHLSDEITLDHLASHIFCSKYHYHRIFQAMVGEPAIEYIRKRRLSHAAKLLTETQSSIMDIALECGYSSQISFTKAFKKAYGINPGEYRRSKNAVALYEKVCLIGREFEKNHQGITIGPKIIRQDEIRLVGIEYRTPRDYIKTKIVNDLFSLLYARIGEIPNKISEIRVGNCCYDSRREQLTYLACVEVSEISDVPQGMTARIIPPSSYAQFTHKGLFEKNIHTFSYVFGTWLPESGYRVNDDIHLVERFNPDFQAGGDATIEMSFALL